MNKEIHDPAAAQLINRFNTNANISLAEKGAKELYLNAVSMPWSDSLAFLNKIPHVFADIYARNNDRNRLEQAYQILFDDILIIDLIKPTLFGIPAPQKAPINCYAPDIREIEPLPENFPIAHRLNKTQQFDLKIIPQIASSICREVPDLRNSITNKLAIFGAQKLIATAIGEFIENTHPDALTNPDHEIWQGDVPLIVMLDIRDKSIENTIKNHEQRQSLMNMINRNLG